ncbi:MAG: hypothetical protein KDK72_10425 [Chlamydiia bacterium]|nr:hypothetical protein [Chlamydiia bacterium]
MSQPVNNFPPPVFTKAPSLDIGSQRTSQIARGRSYSTPVIAIKPPTPKTYTPRGKSSVPPFPIIEQAEKWCMEEPFNQKITSLIERYFHSAVREKITETPIVTLADAEDFRLMARADQNCVKGALKPLNDKLTEIIKRINERTHSEEVTASLRNVVCMIAEVSKNSPQIFLQYYEKLNQMPEMRNDQVARAVESIICGTATRKEFISLLQRVERKYKEIIEREIAISAIFEAITRDPLYCVERKDAFASKNPKEVVDTIVRGETLCFERLVINGETIDFSHCTKPGFIEQVMRVILQHLYTTDVEEKLHSIMNGHDFPKIFWLMTLGSWGEILNCVGEKLPILSPPIISLNFAITKEITIQIIDDESFSLTEERSVEFYVPTASHSPVLSMDLYVTVENGFSKIFIRNLKLVTVDPFWVEKVLKDFRVLRKSQLYIDS